MCLCVCREGGGGGERKRDAHACHVHFPKNPKSRGGFLLFLGLGRFGPKGSRSNKGGKLLYMLHKGIVLGVQMKIFYSGFQV